MSKNLPKKLLIKNKSNSLKIIENKKSLFKCFQYENQNNKEQKHKKNQMNKFIVHNKELNNDLDNKENINIKNINNNRNQINNNDYDFKQNYKNNECNIITYEKIKNLDYYKKKQSRNLLCSKFYDNKNKNIISKTNNNLSNKYEIKRKKNQLENINSTLNNKFSLIFNNQQFPQKNYDDIITDERPLTERESTNTINNNYHINRINSSKNLNFKNNYFLPKNNSGKKTLILDLDETLIHSSFKPFNMDNEFIININTKNKSKINEKEQYIVYVIKRPYVELFLSIVCEIFEVVVFTASVQVYANLILDEIDIEKKIKYRLYRDHCIKIDNDKYIKNLYCLGRDLKNVIIIDNNPLSYTLNIENGLPISTWETNQNDNELIKLIPILQYLSDKDVSDVRPIIKRIVKNQIINYDEVNKIINKNNNDYYIKKERQSYNDEKLNKEVNENYIEKIPKKRNKIYKKLEYNNNEIYYFNNSISNNQNIIKNIFVNRENQIFIKNLRNINKKNNRGKSEDNRTKKNNLQDNEERSITTFNKSKNLNISEKNIISKSEYKSNIINDIIKKNKGNKSFFEIKKRNNLNIPLPNNYGQIIPTNKINSIIGNRFYSKSLSRNSTNRNNYSDFNYRINNKAKKDNKFGVLYSLKYPQTLKNIFYQKIFQNNFFNKIPINSRNSSRNNNKEILTAKSSQKNLLFNFKRNIINFKDNKTKNYSFESYINSKYNIAVLKNNLNKYLTKFIINNQKNKINENKELNINKDNKIMKENNSYKIIKNHYNIYHINKSLKNVKTDNTTMKHSFSFLNKNKKIKDYISIINGYRRSNKKIE